MITFHLFIVTNSPIFGKDKILKKVLKDENLDSQTTIYIGDETRDIEAGTIVGLKTVAVTWGYENEAVLKKSNPTHIVKRPKDLLSIFN